MIARAQTVLLVLVLLGAGVLLGSFLLEWRGRELAAAVDKGIDVLGMHLMHLGVLPSVRDAEKSEAIHWLLKSMTVLAH